MKLNLVTWNVSAHDCGHLARFSLTDKFGHILRMIRERKPNVVCLQECTDLLVSFIAREAPMWILLGKSNSHCNFTATFVADIALISSHMQTVELCAGVLVSSFGKALSVVNCHLVPFKDNGEERVQQLEMALEYVEQDENASTDSLVIAGDLNIREAEMQKFLKSPRAKAATIRDTWKLAAGGGDVATKFTWDTAENHYFDMREGMPGIRARFDRVLAGGSKSTISQYSLVGNTRVQGTFPSDHYGIHVTLD